MQPETTQLADDETQCRIAVTRDLLERAYDELEALEQGLDQELRVGVGDAALLLGLALDQLPAR